MLSFGKWEAQGRGLLLPALFRRAAIFYFFGQIFFFSGELKSQGYRKRDYSILHTARSIIRNLCEGLVIGYTIKMKIVFAHFPITVKVQDRTVIENLEQDS